MPIKFEGDPPYDLPIAQSAEARAEGINVELVLYVSVPGKLPSPAPVRVQMKPEIAWTLVTQMQPCATAAEMRRAGGC